MICCGLGSVIFWSKLSTEVTDNVEVEVIHHILGHLPTPVPSSILHRRRPSAENKVNAVLSPLLLIRRTSKFIRLPQHLPTTNKRYAEAKSAREAEDKIDVANKEGKSQYVM